MFDQTTTLDAYLNSEKGTPKNEFLAGELRPLPEVEDSYFAIRMNLAFLLNEHFSKSHCKVYVAEAKLYVEATHSCFYPDLLVSCETEGESGLYKTRAHLLVEVVNESSSGYKRGRKLFCYRQAEVAEILLINAESPGVEYWRRKAQHWTLQDFAETDELRVAGVNFHCAVAEIYQDVFE